MRLILNALLFTACTIICVSAEDINTSTQLCINDITVVNDQIVVLKSTIDNFTSRAGCGLMQAKQQEVEKGLLKSITSCHDSTSLGYNDKEAEFISLTVAKYSVYMIATMRSYRKKRFELAAFTSMKHNVDQLANHTNLLKAALLTPKTSSEGNSILETYFDQLNDSFQSIKTKYESAMDGIDEEISKYLYECTDRLIDINRRLVAVKTLVDTFTFSSAARQPSWSGIDSKLRDTENLIMQCLPSCGRPLQRPFTVDEENELFSNFVDFSTNVCTVLTTLEDRKLELLAAGLNSQVVKTRIESILDHTHSLSNHVTKKVGPSLLPTAERYVGQMVASFQKAIATYSLKSLVIPS